MEEEKKDALAPKSDSAIKPLITESGALAGKEQTYGMEAYIIPRLALLQKGSSLLDQNVGIPGDFVNSMMLSNYGKEVVFVPLIRRKSRLYFRQGEGLACRSFNAIEGQGNPGGLCAKCPLSKWPNKGDLDENGKQLTAPPCNESWDFISIIPDDIETDLPIVVSFRASSAQEGKKLNTMIDLVKDQETGQYLNPWFFEYKVNSVQKSSKNFTFYIAQVRRIKRTENPMEYEVWYNRISGKNIQTDISDLEQSNETPGWANET